LKSVEPLHSLSAPIDEISSQVVDHALELLDAPATNSGSPPSGEHPPPRDDPTPRPSWRVAALAAGFTGADPLTSLHAELRLKTEMLAAAATTARRRLDAARGCEAAAAAQIDRLRRDLEAGRQVRGPTGLSGLGLHLPVCFRVRSSIYPCLTSLD
jgi:hypothetical protein